MLHQVDDTKTKRSVIDQQIIRFGGSLPNEQQTPKLYYGLGLFKDAFFDLDSERDISKYQPIAWSSIINYSEYYQMPTSVAEDMVTYIRSIDNAYLRALMNRNQT